MEEDEPEQDDGQRERTVGITAKCSSCGRKMFLSPPCLNCGCGLEQRDSYVIEKGGRRHVTTVFECPECGGFYRLSFEEVERPEVEDSG